MHFLSFYLFRLFYLNREEAILKISALINYNHLVQQDDH